MVGYYCYLGKEHNSRTVPAKGRRPLSMDLSSMFNPKNSVIYSLLPSAVQSRLPKLGSIRKTMCSTYGLDLQVEDGEHKAPLEEYTSEIVLREATPEIAEYGSYFEDQLGVGEYDKAAVKMRSRQQLPESESGIDWKVANQGKSETIIYLAIALLTDYRN